MKHASSIEKFPGLYWTLLSEEKRIQTEELLSSPTGAKFAAIFTLLAAAAAVPDGDLCRWMNGRKYYLDVGESGVVTVANVSSRPHVPQRCSVELISCPECHITVTFLSLSIATCSSDSSCRCDYVWIREPAYTSSGREFCGFIPGSYQSRTKLVSVDFLYSYPHQNPFALQFTAERKYTQHVTDRCCNAGNVYTITGNAEVNSTGVVQSPHFPAGYPSDYSSEYILHNTRPHGVVQLIFTDFQLSPWSYLEVLSFTNTLLDNLTYFIDNICKFLRLEKLYESNGSRIDIYNGNTFRPPLITSSGPSLVLKFRANDENASPGFKAKYTFLPGRSSTGSGGSLQASTDCGGNVDDLGGAITMMNMAAGGLYDCVWLLYPRAGSSASVAVRLAQFEEMGECWVVFLNNPRCYAEEVLIDARLGKHQMARTSSSWPRPKTQPCPESSLEIRQGLTSESFLLDHVTSAHPPPHRSKEFVVPASQGFYVRLVGRFSNRSHLALTYAVFSYDECYKSDDFRCSNKRCIKVELRCDGFNHCGDGSDETGCLVRWYNYYNRKDAEKIRMAPVIPVRRYNYYNRKNTEKIRMVPVIPVRQCNYYNRKDTEKISMVPVIPVRRYNYYNRKDTEKISTTPVIPVRRYNYYNRKDTEKIRMTPVIPVRQCNYYNRNDTKKIRMAPVIPVRRYNYYNRKDTEKISTTPHFYVGVRGPSICVTAIKILPLTAYGRAKFAAIFTLLAAAAAVPDGDLCRWMNGRKYYLDVGESGVVTVANVSSRPHVPQRCSVELISCPECHITVTFLSLSIATCSSDSSCRCDYVWIREPAYTSSGREFCGFIPGSYQSRTKLVSVDFLYSYPHQNPFALQFTAERNVYTITGNAEVNSTGVVQSPHFPAGYPSDYSSEYILHNTRPHGVVQLIFTDFQLSPWSYLELYESNGSRIDIYNGNTFRPPLITSSGPSLVLKFRANDENASPGFKAKYTFLPEDRYGHDLERSPPFRNYMSRHPALCGAGRSSTGSGGFLQASTDCGGNVDDLGGAITMMNMAAGGLYDCVWLLYPRAGSSASVAVRLAQFEEMDKVFLNNPPFHAEEVLIDARLGKHQMARTSSSWPRPKTQPCPESSLEIRQGLTSESFLLDHVTSAHPPPHRSKEFVVPASQGFYVRLVGRFSNRSHLALTYAVFSYDGTYTVAESCLVLTDRMAACAECYKSDDFRCSNKRCIKVELRCDGFNHCGDGSDETGCLGESLLTST
ncbi:hypothetical protein LAZ67_13003317 [Cordylochernes scorpioides]|uniref:CUB domain-containing protein n=1 Tax=Cordylochernes scorpioides TaxID=51811 RepID=A0ABY6L991_9ARAC|nr:hypothetical protein LAZ67_13003317 [Cordylochernes scorpioides]